MPCISVIVPVYQAEKLLPACVESVKKQTFSDWELLLVDDGCTDASPALCDRYAAEDPRIRALHQPKNAGVSEARNRGLREAAGEYIAFLDADDAFEPQTLETMWRLREQTGADSVGCAHRNVTPAGDGGVELLLSALVAALTVGGKAFGKTFAIHMSTPIVQATAKALTFFKTLPAKFRKKR